MQQLSFARWGLLLTEMVLIVASILLAFALDSWWDERRDRLEEQAILHGLREEFLLNRSMLERRVAQHTKEQAELEILRAATKSGRWATGDPDLDAALAATITPPTTDLGNGVLDALISSGRIELLQNQVVAGDCVTVEQVGDSANIRRADPVLCEPETREVMPELQDELNEEADECYAAKQELLAAETDERASLAARKVSILCNN